MASTLTAEDWALDWGGLPGYPALPRLFTNAKTAKKRRHRECAAASSEADLDRVVKLPKRAAAATAPAAAGTQQQAATAAKLSKAERKAQQLQRTAAGAGAGAAAEPQAAAAAESKKAAKRDSKQLAGKAPGNVAAAAAPESSIGKKRKQATQQQHSDGGADAAPAAAVPALPKKSRRNKFKQQERMAAEQQQQQQAGTPQQQEQHTQKKQKQTRKQLQKQQAGKAAPAPAGAAMAARAPPTAGASAKAGGSSGSGACGSKLLQQFKERLQGSRFRQLNEALYTQPGAASFSSMQSEPELFSAYHEGFQQQVKAWPQQPLDAAISWLQGRSSDLVVADFGCGEAQLAASVKQEVHSLDLVAAGPGVIACNMAHTPLDTGSCDVAVFSLALMGTDYGSFLVEAARVLKPSGWLWVAEVRSRFAGAAAGTEDFKPFLAALQQLGFKLASQDASNRMFVVWVLRKGKHSAGSGSSGGGKGIRWPKLKACVYKKR